MATARRLQIEHQQQYKLVRACGEHLPLPADQFDFAISEYGAALWADPYQWVPEAYRVLKPGGRLVFLTNAAFATVCLPDYDASGPVKERLLRPYFDMYRINWPDTPDQTEFHLNHSDWIALFRQIGFKIDALKELRAPVNGSTSYTYMDPNWARCWPSEEVWFLIKEN